MRHMRELTAWPLQKLHARLKASAADRATTV
jgi:hypothetical protein